MEDKQIRPDKAFPGKYFRICGHCDHKEPWKGNDQCCSECGCLIPFAVEK